MKEVQKEADKLTHWYSKKVVDDLYSYVKPEIQEQTDEYMLKLTLSKLPNGNKFDDKLDN